KNTHYQRFRSSSPLSYAFLVYLCEVKDLPKVHRIFCFGTEKIAWMLDRLAAPPLQSGLFAAFLGNFAPILCRYGFI
ncbi:MAG: hypothetical protein IKN53_05235, partial [Oscillibacter sp.]|nr:hypothetical protein [Oscillibacter sp.]